MTEEVQREFRDQTSRPRIEEAESSWSSREATSLGQPGPRTFTIATPTVSLTTTPERMPSPTTTVQPHWTAPTRPTPKGKELEDKSVKDQRPDCKENDMRDHWSGCNDEDGDHLKLDFERLDEEDQDPNKETEQTDVPNQVSKINNNQITGVEPQHGHDDCHSQVYGRHSQILGVEPQVPTTRRSDNQVTGVEPQVSTSRELDNQVTGVESQVTNNLWECLMTKLLGWNPRSQHPETATKVLGWKPKTMTATARSMAGIVKYWGWSFRPQHLEDITTK